MGVGAIATAIHYAVLISLLQRLSVEPVSASAIGFVIAASCNYLLNYHSAFESGEQHMKAISRFTLVATAGLLFNTFTMSFLLRFVAAPNMFGQIAATFLLMAWNFLVNRKWIFKNLRVYPGRKKRI